MSNLATVLKPQMRGDTFERSFTLKSPWSGNHFTGGVRFTLRRHTAQSAEVDDDGAVDQATTDADEVTFDGIVGTVLIPAERTNAWPVKKLIWDLQGIVSGDPDRVYTIDSGVITILADVTRSQ